MLTVKIIRPQGSVVLHDCSFITMHEPNDDGTREFTLADAIGGKESVSVHLGPADGGGRFCQHIYIMNSAGKTIEALHADAEQTPPESDS